VDYQATKIKEGVVRRDNESEFVEAYAVYSPSAPLYQPYEAAVGTKHQSSFYVAGGKPKSFNWSNELFKWKMLLSSLDEVF
jgi:hypothetical protein